MGAFNLAYRDGRKQTDNGHNDHDLSEAETCFVRHFGFHVLFLLSLRCERCRRRIIIITFLFTIYCRLQPQF